MGNTAEFNTAGKRVLVVEDEPDINRLVAYHLGREGFCVEQVFDGRRAQEKLTQEVFAAVVLDIMLPGIDGFQICKALKDGTAAFKTAVVILTAKRATQDKIYANLVGADYYLAKPFSAAKLTAIVKELVSLRNREYKVGHGTTVCRHAGQREEAPCAHV